MAVAFSLRRRIFAEHINVRTFIIIAIAGFAFTGAAAAQTIPTGTSDVERPFGMGWDNFDQPINPSTRDENGNRTIVNGRMEIEGTLSGGLMDNYASGFGSATAIGNQLNVVTQGNYNTVIVDSTQINNGDISAEAGD
jgi:holdfast attachment protein HfaA